MNIRYLLLRLIRHFIPEGLARFLLKRRWIIKPGLESTDPASAVEKYLNALSEYQISIQGKKVLVFGYGGRFAVAVELLKRGAGHIVLCDHFVLLDHERNRELLQEYGMYLEQNQNEVKPRSECMTLLHGDIRTEAIQQQISQVDIVLSNSVYEHLDDVNGITESLARLTSPFGSHLHFVDLRDHYFKYPFEMLKFNEKIWKNFLNPSSNLNRFRFNNYQSIFKRYFKNIELKILERDIVEFQKAEKQIRSEFKIGDEIIDSITLIYIFSSNPINLDFKYAK